MIAIEPPPPAKPLYVDLGVRETASEREIRDAWRRLALRNHPDQQGGRSTEYYERARHAFAVLSDRAARNLYDETGIDPVGGMGGIRSNAQAVIAQTAFRVLADAGANINILERMLAALRRDHKVAAAQLREVDAALDKGAAARENISARWKGAEAARQAILAMLDANTARDQQTRSQVAESVHVVALALQMLDGATYEMPAIPTSVRPATFKFFDPSMWQRDPVI